MLAPTCLTRGRCLPGVDARSKGSPAFVALDAEPKHEIRQTCRLGAPQRPTSSPLEAGPPLDGCARKVLGGLLAHLLLCGSEMPRVGSPAVRVKLREAQRGQQLLQLQNDVVLAPSEPLRQDRARGRSQGGPPPARGRFPGPVPPHGGQLCGASPTALPGRRAAARHRHLRGRPPLSQGRGHGRERRGLFLPAVITVLGRTCTTRAVSRLPLACRAIATSGAVAAGDGPGARDSRRNVRPAPRWARPRSRGLPWRGRPWRTLAVL
jgi:hypothetical protein